MAVNWIPLLLILATLSAFALEEVASASSRRSRRQTTGGQSPMSNAVPTFASPCPDILRVPKVLSNSGRWSGRIEVTADEATTGVVLDIQLDRRSDLVGSSFGRVYTKDSITHTIRNDTMEVGSGEKIVVEFFVKYQGTAAESPSVTSIRFNGKQICPPEQERTEPPYSAPPITTSESPPPPTTPSSPNAGDRSKSFSEMLIIPSSVPPRLPPVESSRHVMTAQLYEISGEFKIKSNASLSILLIARPPQPHRDVNSDEPNKESNLEDLLVHVFGVPKESTGSTTSFKFTGPRNPNGGEDIAGDSFDDNPPFTSAPELPTAAVLRPTGTSGPLRIGGEVEGEPLQWESPCPEVLTYVSKAARSGTWYGKLSLTSREHLVGVRLDIELDKPSRFLGAWLGEVTTADNINYIIWNFSAEIEAGEAVDVRIFAKYDPEATEPPRIRTIKLNGRQICPTRIGVS